MQPAPREAILAWLSELYLKTAKPGSTDEDFKARMMVYARSLGSYPADVVEDVVRNWKGLFFPAYAELASKLDVDRRLTERRLRIKAFEDFLGHKQPPKKPLWRPLGSEIAKIKARIDAEFSAEKPPSQSA